LVFVFPQLMRDPNIAQKVIGDHVKLYTTKELEWATKFISDYTRDLSFELQALVKGNTSLRATLVVSDHVPLDTSKFSAVHDVRDDPGVALSAIWANTAMAPRVTLYIMNSDQLDVTVGVWSHPQSSYTSIFPVWEPTSPPRPAGGVDILPRGRKKRELRIILYPNEQYPGLAALGGILSARYSESIVLMEPSSTRAVTVLSADSSSACIIANPASLPKWAWKSGKFKHPNVGGPESGRTIIVTPYPIETDKPTYLLDTSPKSRGDFARLRRFARQIPRALLIERSYRGVDRDTESQMPDSPLIEFERMSVTAFDRRTPLSYVMRVAELPTDGTGYGLADPELGHIIWAGLMSIDGGENRLGRFTRIKTSSTKMSLPLTQVAQFDWGSDFAGIGDVVVKAFGPKAIGKSSLARWLKGTPWKVIDSEDFPGFSKFYNAPDYAEAFPDYIVEQNEWLRAQCVGPTVVLTHTVNECSVIAKPGPRVRLTSFWDPLDIARMRVRWKDPRERQLATFFYKLWKTSGATYSATPAQLAMYLRHWQPQGD
jgi:hypothetical protein